MYEKGFYHDTYYTQAKIITVEIYIIEQLFFILRIILGSWGTLIPPDKQIIHNALCFLKFNYFGYFKSFIINSLLRWL